jgi:hypothetical protein
LWANSTPSDKTGDQINRWNIHLYLVGVGLNAELTQPVWEQWPSGSLVKTLERLGETGSEPKLTVFPEKKG